MSKKRKSPESLIDDDDPGLDVPVVDDEGAPVDTDNEATPDDEAGVEASFGFGGATALEEDLSNRLAAALDEVALWKKRYENARLRVEAFNMIGKAFERLGYVPPEPLRQ